MSPMATRALRRGASLVVLAAATLALAPTTSTAGTKVYEDGDTYIEVGARVQIQYRYLETEDRSIDDTFFRRLRPYVAGSLTKNWMGIVEMDFGKSLDADEISLKDAYFMYNGFSNTSYTLRFGNAKAPFGREFLTSSKKLNRAEIAATGDHNFGTLDRVLGVHMTGTEANGKFGWGFSAGAEDHDPGSATMDFDTPVNDQADWNQGWAGAGRLELFPLGPMKYDQGDFHSPDPRFSIAVAAFGWTNDGDRNLYTDADSSLNSRKADLDQAVGVELSGGFRGRGISADAELHLVQADTRVKTFTGGLYKDGSTDLTVASATLGYMVINKRLEPVVGWEMVDATNYAEAWTTIYLGANLYLDKHNVKFQGGYLMGRNAAGAKDVDLNQAIVQGSFVF